MPPAASFFFIKKKEAKKKFSDIKFDTGQRRFNL